MKRIIAGISCLFTVCSSLALAQEAAGSPESLPFSFDMDLAYEYRLAPSGEFLVEQGDVKSGIDLMRNVFDRAPFGRLAMRYGRSEGLAVVAETTFRPQWEGDWYKPDNLPVIGDEGDPFKFENFFITKGVVYWRDPVLSFALGRDAVAYGGILAGSLLPSSRLPYLDNFRARMVLGNFAIDYMVATIQALRSWDGHDVDPNAGLAPGVVYYDWEDGANPTTIVEGLSRFSWQVGNLNLAITDHAMMARRNNRFYLTDIFPLTSRHQTSIVGTNNSLILDASWKAAEGLLFAAQAGIDDVNAELFGVSDTAAPTIDAYVAGFQYRSSSGNGNLHASGELGYTSYLWGNYDGSGINPRDVNPLMRMQYRMLTDSGALLLPLTSPYGPGAVWLKATASYDIPRTGLRTGFDLLLLSKNESANLIDTPLDRSAEDGPLVYFGEVSAPVSYALDAWEVALTPTLLVRSEAWNTPDWSFELSLYAAYHLRTANSTARGDRR